MTQRTEFCTNFKVKSTKIKKGCKLQCRMITLVINVTCRKICTIYSHTFINCISVIDKKNETFVMGGYYDYQNRILKVTKSTDYVHKIITVNFLRTFNERYFLRSYFCILLSIKFPSQGKER